MPKNVEMGARGHVNKGPTRGRDGISELQLYKHLAHTLTTVEQKLAQIQRVSASGGRLDAMTRRDLREACWLSNSTKRLVEERILVDLLCNPTEEPALEPLNLVPLISDLRAQITSTGLFPNQPMVIDAEESPMVAGHPRLLRGMLRAIIESALAHGLDHQPVMVHVEPRKTFIHVHVVSRGCHSIRRTCPCERMRLQILDSRMAFCQEVARVHWGWLKAEAGPGGIGLSFSLSLQRARQQIGADDTEDLPAQDPTGLAERSNEVKSAVAKTQSVVGYPKDVLQHLGNEDFTDEEEDLSYQETPLPPTRK